MVNDFKIRGVNIRWVKSCHSCKRPDNLRRASDKRIRTQREIKGFWRKNQVKLVFIFLFMPEFSTVFIIKKSRANPYTI